jgi:putative endonuclease
MNQMYVYIMTNRSRTLYVGVTNNLERRVFEHKNHIVKGFTSRYRIDMLVYYEMTQDADVAITREKRIKGWLRSKKIALIESMNPEWDDLAAGWFGPSDSSGLRPSE